MLEDEGGECECGVGGGRCLIMQLAVLSVPFYRTDAKLQKVVGECGAARGMSLEEGGGGGCFAVYSEVFADSLHRLSTSTLAALLSTTRYRLSRDHL